MLRTDHHFANGLRAAVATLACVTSLAAAPFNTAASEAVGDDIGAFRFDASAARHLFNRAGFGATRAEVDEAVEAGLDQTVARLLAGPDEPVMPYFAERLGPRDMRSDERAAMRSSNRGNPDGMKREVRERRAADREQFRRFRAWWVARMVASEDPLRERMTLFWHGHFTSAFRDVKSSFEMIRQNQLMREHALGDFGDLLSGIVRDPAMLEYLDNDSNKKGKPNENFARELMELFTLGEGNYDEDDVKEAARALTGYSDREGEFRFRRGAHDRGRKDVLGTRGRLDGDDVVEILLQHEACADWIAGQLIAYFEGIEADPARLRSYASLLRDSGFDVSLFLGQLFRDPEFYRDEVVGTRIASPIDFLVGTTRRLGIDPPEALIVAGAESLGEALLDPPDVKGWDGGRAWITTQTMMLRANLAGVLLGEVGMRDTLDDWARHQEEAMAQMDAKDEMQPMRQMEPMDEMEPRQSWSDTKGPSQRARGKKRQPPTFGGSMGALSAVKKLAWRPALNLSWRAHRAGASTDAEIAQWLAGELIAVDVSPATSSELEEAIARTRGELDVADGELLELGDDSEYALRRLAHLTLSFPEAQLH